MDHLSEMLTQVLVQAPADRVDVDAVEVREGDLAVVYGMVRITKGLPAPDHED